MSVERKISLSYEPPTDVPRITPALSPHFLKFIFASAIASRAASQPSLSLRELRVGAPSAIRSRWISPVRICP
jgi:hypothetical protein